MGQNIPLGVFWPSRVMTPGLLSGAPGTVWGQRPTHYDPWPPRGRRIVARYKGELIPPGRVVCVDGSGLLWLPDAAILRPFYGVSMRPIGDGYPFTERNIEELRNTLGSDMSTMLAGDLFVEADGSDVTGVVNVHAPSTGTSCLGGMVTSLPASSVPGAEVIPLTRYSLEAGTTSDSVWYVSVNLP